MQPLSSRFSTWNGFFAEPVLWQIRTFPPTRNALHCAAVSASPEAPTSGVVASGVHAAAPASTRAPTARRETGKGRADMGSSSRGVRDTTKESGIAPAGVHDVRQLRRFHRFPG